MAYESSERARQFARDNLTDETLVTIILSASAAEGFFNDLIGVIDAVAQTPGRPRDLGFDRLAAIAKVLESLEDDRVNVIAKYEIAGQLLSCPEIVRARNPLQAVVDLMRLRNGIVHVKPVSTEEKGRLAELAATFAQRGLCKRIDDSKRNTMNAETWWVVVRTPEVARWAVESAGRLITTLAQAAVAIGDYNGILASLCQIAKDPTKSSTP